MARTAPIRWWNEPNMGGVFGGQPNTIQGVPYPTRSASPYASPSYRPYVRPQATTPTAAVDPVVAAPQMPTQTAPAGLLGQGGSGLLNAAGVIGKASGPTAMPVSLGSMIGPAFQAFGQGVDADRKAQEAKAREQALIAKYGPEAMVPGAMAAIITTNAEREALASKNKLLKEFLSGGGQQGPITPDVTASGSINVSAPKSAPKFNEEEKAIIAFAKNTGDGVKTVYANRQEKYKLAVTRVTPARKNIQIAQTGINKVTEAVKQKNATADIAAVNAYQRLIDPGVVKGEDIQLQRDATSLGLALKQWALKAKTGEILPDPVRKRMLSMANLLGKAVVEVNREEILGQKDRFEMNKQLDWRRVWPKRWDALLSSTKYLKGTDNIPNFKR